MNTDFGQKMTYGVISAEEFKKHRFLSQGIETYDYFKMQDVICLVKESTSEEKDSTLVFILKGENCHGYIFELDQKEYEIVVGFVRSTLGHYTGHNYTPEEIERIKREWKETNAPLGRELGYPECCIGEFCDLPPELMLGTPNEEMKIKLEASFINGKYSGFIPCLKHAKMILAGEITLSDLIQNRNPAFPPFPELEYHED